MSARHFDAKFGATRLDEVPRAPGVYEWLGPAEQTLYVGKAANLRNRLRQYRNASRRKAHRKMRALVAAGRLGDERVVTDVLPLAHHAEVGLREAAVFALARIHDARASAALVEAIGDHRPSVAALACIGLASSGDGKSVSAALAVLADRTRPDLVRAACAAGLAAAGGAASAGLIAAVGDTRTPDAAGIPGECREFQPQRAPDGVWVMIEEGKLTRITLSELSTVKTDKGFGLGDKPDAVKAAYPDAKATPHKYQDKPAEYITWWQGGPRTEAYVQDETARGVALDAAVATNIDPFVDLLDQGGVEHDAGRRTVDSGHRLPLLGGR